MSVRKRKWKTREGITTVWQVDYTDQNGERASKQFRLKKEADDYHAASARRHPQGAAHLAEQEPDHQRGRRVLAQARCGQWHERRRPRRVDHAAPISPAY